MIIDRSRVEQKLIDHVKINTVCLSVGCLRFEATYDAVTEMITVTALSLHSGGTGGGCHEHGGKDTGKRDPLPDKWDSWGDDTSVAPPKPTWRSEAVVAAKKKYAVWQQRSQEIADTETAARNGRLRETLLKIPNINQKSVWDTAVWELGELYSDEGMSGGACSSEREAVAASLSCTPDLIGEILANMVAWEIPMDILTAPSGQKEDKNGIPEEARYRAEHSRSRQ